MKPSRAKRFLRGLGFILCIAAPLCVIGAGVYSGIATRLYFASTEFELRFPDVDKPRLPVAFEQVQLDYANAFNRPMTAEVNLLQSGAPNQYSISALDADAQTSANTANFLTLRVMETICDAGQPHDSRIHVLRPAEKSLYFAYPNMYAINIIGTFAAVVCGSAGILFLVLACAPPPKGSTTEQLNS